MLIYNQFPHRSLSNSRPIEVHRTDGNILDTFLKQYSNSSEGSREVKKKKFNVGDIIRINRTTKVFEKGNYFRSTELLKCPES